MNRSALGLFLCYPLLPVAMGCGMGLLQGQFFGLVAVLYYVLLLGSLWSLRHFGGWVGGWYLLAFAIAWVHLIAVGGVLISRASMLHPSSEDSLIPVILATILGVYLAACCAAAALGFRLQRPVSGMLQLLAPFLLCLGFAGWFGAALVLLAFGGQALHALFLSWRSGVQAEGEELHPGLSPVRRV